MQFGNLSGLINGTETVVFDYEVSGSAVASISTGSILNGNEDGFYTVIVRSVDSAANYGMRVRMNADSGANYGVKAINATSGSILDRSYTVETSAILTDATNASNVGLSIFKIAAKSGTPRMAVGNFMSRVSTSLVFMCDHAGWVWNDSSTNITSMTFIAASGNINIGTHITILKQNNFTNGTPTGIITTPYLQGSWYRVGSNILGAATNQVTFSGLNGDNDLMYLLTWNSKGGGASGNHNLTLNTDTAANYAECGCYGNLTTAAQIYNTAMSKWRTSLASASSYYGWMLIFAKSGFQRVSLTEYACNYTVAPQTMYMTSEGQVWSNTASNITQMVLTDPNAGNQILTGSQFQLYALRPNG